MTDAFVPWCEELPAQAVDLSALTRRIARDIERETEHAASSSRWRSCGPVAAVAPVDPAEIARLASYVDAGHFENWQEQRDVSAEDRRFAYSAHGAFLSLLRERTGEFQHPEMQAKFERQAKAMAELSDAICAKMALAADPAAVRELCDEAATLAASAGADRESARQAFLPIAREFAPRFNAFRADSGWELWRYYVHSRQLEKLPNYRRIRFIPYVAQSLRGSMLASLDFWLSKNPMARFWTFTSGLRVRLDGVGDRADELHKKLRALNKRKFMRDVGVQIVFRSTEMGTPETNERGDVVDGGRIEYDATGQSYFHVHAHCVVELTKGRVPDDKWSALLEKVHKFWRFRWQDDGVIRDGREVCKYVTKPGEMLRLSADELVALEEQLSRVRLIETAGSLRAEIKAREDAGERLVKRRTPDGRVYFVVKDWNKHVTRTDTESAQDAAQKLTPSTARGCLRLVSRGTPRFGRNGVAEPVATFMVMRGSWNEAQARAVPFVAHVIGATERNYRDGVARRLRALVGDRINVHTRTPTVRAERESAIPSWASGPPVPVFSS